MLVDGRLLFILIAFNGGHLGGKPQCRRYGVSAYNCFMFSLFQLLPLENYLEQQRQQQPRRKFQGMQHEFKININPVEKTPFFFLSCQNKIEMPSSSPTLSAPPPPLSSSNPKKSKKMQYGDVVVAYISPQNMSTLILVPGGILQNKFGAFHHDAMVNMEFGSKIPSSSNSSSAGASSGFIHALRLTPELWTLSLPHRTQILYSVDISFVSIQLGLMNGTRMIEAGKLHLEKVIMWLYIFNGKFDIGTGSGSFSHSIARSVAPNGHLFTFEYHQQRAEQAKKEFLLHGLLCKSQHQQALDLMSASIGNSSSSTATASNANEDILLNTLKHRLESTPSDYHGVISSFHRDVCKDGFGLEEKDTKGISAGRVIYYV